jgi:predicted N-acyltransferase
VHLRDPAEIIRAYTPDAHKLYLAVVGKSKVKLEILPMQFFAELTRSFPGALSLSLLLSGDKLVAFNWGLFQDRVFYYLFCGLDYGADADIYFNLMYRQLDYAFRRSPKLVSFGQTAESFKARLGCQAHARYAFVRGNKFAIKLLLKYFSCIIFRKPDPSPHYSVFKYQGSTTQPARGHSDNILDLELK